MVPTPRYFMSCIALAQVAPILARAAASSAGEGPSSQTFWWRRCSEQSRSPRWIAPPRPSPSTWISMWRGFCRYFSRETEASPNADLASLEAVESASIRSSAVCATFMPRPPPPEAAFTSTGKPISCAIATASSSGPTLPSEPGTTGMPEPLRGLLGFDLVAHQTDVFGLWPDKMQIVIGEYFGKAGVLREKTVA